MFEGDAESAHHMRQAAYVCFAASVGGVVQD